MTWLRTNGARGLALAAAVTFAAPAAVWAQQGSVTGVVRDQSTGGPLATVQVFIPALDIGVLSQENGRFLLLNVPAGTHTVRAERIGYRAGSAEVTVTAGGTAVADFAMQQEALALEQIVVTGLVDPVAGVRAPITVGRVDRERMPITVASGAAVENLAGRVAGVRVNRVSGQPGEGVTMMLRTPTTLRGSGAPLIVVDGVILSGEGLPPTVDIDGMDIESIEVIKGASAASLYGSRAAAGVINITTRRGNTLPAGQTRFTARTEYGISQNVRNVALNDSHAFLMDPSRTQYVDALGNPVDRDDRVMPNLTQAFLDKPYPVGVYDNLGAITHAGSFISNNFSITGNEGSTNFAVTYNNLREEGILLGNDGYRRNSFRVNVDHRFLETMTLGVSMYHSRDWRDDQSSTGNDNPFNLTLYAPRDVDLSRRGEDGSFLQQPDPTIAYQSPVWTETTREFEREGSRTLANVNLTWSPVTWFSANANIGYDRGDLHIRQYVPKGTPADVGTVGALDGEITFEDNLDEAFNAQGQITFRRDFGLLNARTTFRGLLEDSHYEDAERTGEDFIIGGVPQLSAIRPEDQEASSSQQDVKALGVLWDTALDYDGRYIFTVLGRRDGSSLFGPDNRWHNYYRLAGAWRVAQESWFNIPNINELKLSMARGTAGGRPDFSWQYEAWELEGGVPTKDVLGNRQLAPEHTTENEISLSMIVFDRFGFTATYARQRTENQLNPVPIPAITGYGSQWVNTGTIEGHSLEFELEAQLINEPNWGWTSTFVADYSNATITEWNVPCYAQAWRWNCKDIPVYGIYSRWLVNSREGLNQHDNGSTVAFADEFQVNDEGFLVWVGQGNNYYDGGGPDGTLGTADDLWGTTSTFTNSVGIPYEWGHPFYERTEEGTPHRTLLGEAVPANFGWINNFRWGGLSLHTHLHASIGGQTNNRRFQLMASTQRLTAPFLDQAGKPDELKKPISYYRAAIDGDNTYSIEDSSYMKLRTLGLTYQFSDDRLQGLGLGSIGISDLRVGLTVRNVFTLTTYDGFDPEAGFNLNSRSSSDPGGYPPTRNLTADVTVTF
jgi:TonB-linked SusC/RagA family outer membrane protein